MLAMQVDAAQAERILQAMQAALDRLPFDPPSPAIAPLAQANCRSVRDPSSGEDGVEYEWRDGHGYRVGGLVLHGEGSFFAEFDVLRPYPRDRSQFLEAITAWGRDDTIKTEPRLLPNLD